MSTENKEVKEIEVLPDLRIDVQKMPESPFDSLNEVYYYDFLNREYQLAQSDPIDDDKDLGIAKKHHKKAIEMGENIKKVKEESTDRIKSLLGSFENYGDDLESHCNVVGKLIGKRIDEFEPEKAKERADKIENKKEVIKKTFLDIVKEAQNFKDESVQKQTEEIDKLLHRVNEVDTKEGFGDLNGYATEIKHKAEAQLMTLSRRIISEAPRPAPKKVTGSSEMTVAGGGTKIIAINDNLNAEIQDDLTEEEEKYVVTYYLYAYRLNTDYAQALSKFDREDLYKYLSFVSKNLVSDSIKLSELLYCIENKPLTFCEKVMKWFNR